MMKNLVFALVAFFAIGVGLYGLAYFSFNSSLYFTEYEHLLHKVLLMIHAGCGGLALLLGFWQFNSTWRKNHRVLFRRFGMLYSLLVLISALSGFYVAYHADAALFSGKVGFIILGLVWLYTLYKGLYYVRKKDIVQRRIWFLRNYVLTFSAVILRIQLGFFFLFNVEFEVFYPALAWLCWVPSVLILEYWYLRKYEGVQ